MLRVIDVQLDGVDSRIGPSNLIQQGLATARDDDLIAALVKCLGQSAANAGSLIVDGPVWTSAGMTAALDMALGMVEKDLGTDMARSVAHKLVMHQRRSGGQSQHSELLALAPKSDRIQSALEYARTHLDRPLSVEELADVVHLSPRQFTRVFTAETGQSPAKAVESLRLEAARVMIERSRHSLDRVAKETGFRDRRHMREVFMRGFGVPPQAVRRDARRIGQENPSDRGPHP